MGAYLTITLLKKWLVEYKFKDWLIHSTTPAKLGTPVTDEEKIERAEEIARLLSDNKLWHSHDRMIGISTLQTVLKLKIEDYSNDKVKRSKIIAYNGLLTDYITRHDFQYFFHNRNYF